MVGGQLDGERDVDSMVNVVIDRCKIICSRGSDSDQIDLHVNVKQINLQMPNALVSWVVGSLGGVVGGQLDGGGDVDSWSMLSSRDRRLFVRKFRHKFKR